MKLTEEGPGVTEEFIEVGQISISDPVRLYLNEIGRYPLLTSQQEVELAMQMEAGNRAQARLAEEGLIDDDRAFSDTRSTWVMPPRKQLVQSNLRLVVAGPPLCRPQLALLDLQEGNVGLMRRGAVRLPPRLQVPLPMPPGGSARRSPERSPIRAGPFACQSTSSTR